MSDFDEIFDFVIVGSGGGSMCAALVMRAAGKSVLILEKTDMIGGTTARSGGVMWIPNNPFMKLAGIEDSYEKAVTYLDNTVGDHDDTPGTSPERRSTYVQEGPRMVDFLLKQGIKLTRLLYYPDYYDERPGSSVPGRAVVAELFNAAELGAWRTKLRASAVVLPFLPASLPEMLVLKTLNQSWKAKMTLLKVVLRGLTAKLTGRHWVSSGAALQGRMLQAALRAKVDVRTDTPVRELVVEGGAVKGVVAIIDGRARRLGARLGVLVNAGGFARNQEMRDRYQPGTSANWSKATPGDTGEMIQEMMRHGAAIAQMEEFIGDQMTIPPGMENDELKPTMQVLTAAPHTILVDQSGVRYLNESGSYMDYTKAMLERNKVVPAVPSWAIFDSQFLRKYMFVPGTKPGSKVPRRWIDEGYLRKADTVEGLAGSLKIEPATLKATVDRFNGFVARNRDEDFHRGDNAYNRFIGDTYNKPSASLGTIAEPPFYAIPIIPGDLGTCGGVVTDTHARVLREDGTVIPGLYATGS
ncbi:MAG: FAD-dependent oxidoreductase, partial [Rhodospirillaceae bacterium]